MDLKNKLYFIELSGAAVVALISILVAKVLTPVYQAEWAIYNNFINLSTILVLGGLPASLLLSLRKNEVNQKNALYKAILYSLVGSGATVGIVYLMFSNYSITKYFSIVPQISYGYFFIGLHMLTMIFSNFLSIWMDAHNKLFHLSAGRLISNIILVILISGLAFFSLDTVNKSFLWILKIYIGWQFIFLIYIFILVYFILSTTKNQELESVRFSNLFLHQGWLLLISSLIQWLNYRADLWFVSTYTDKQSTGIYSVAAGMSMYLLLFSRSNQRILLNKFSKNEIQNQRLVSLEFLESCKKLVYITFLGVLFAFLVYKYFLNIEYKQGFLLFNILILGVYFVSITMPFSAYLYYKEKSIYNLWASLLGLILSVLLYFLVIPTYGMVGAAISSCIGYIIMAMAQYIFYRRYSRYVPELT